MDLHCLYASTIKTISLKPDFSDILLEKHDDNLEQYKASAKEALYQFSTENPENINGYKAIIANLLSR
ncbi:hypothetical protein [[Leptolyngbya] sp. PCC 7376]|uniref:hypothetical protein n=1 Tax=[Leptolyngbya] sp. PCC 7376 TaxID=111781 RepID=UPI0002DB8D31|nr:hypothetical protein [[Leptolyngbya] sp. PCC 7376]